MATRRLDLQWAVHGPKADLTLVSDLGRSELCGTASDLSALPSLPRAIAADEPIENIAAAYQELFRHFRPTGGKAHGFNAMEKLSFHLGSEMVDFKLTAANKEILHVLGSPWELLLHDSEREQLRRMLARVAVVRSLGETSAYSPRKIAGPFRVLLLQGANGTVPLNFEGERAALQAAWAALGSILNTRIAEPLIRDADVGQLVANLATVRPHLLWFSGHGRQKGDDFELLFGVGKGEWRSISELACAVEKARDQTGEIPLVAAFWACESAQQKLGGNPLFDSGDGRFPALVKVMLQTGIEAVLGVQTQIYDSTARIMSESFFRALAEGNGPARALARARVDLHDASPFAPGSGSEWTSPVLWINGADLPEIQWDCAVEESEAIIFNWLGRESLLAFEGGGRDLLAEQPADEPGAIANIWSNRAPLWLTVPDLNHAEVEFILLRDLRRLALVEKTTVLLIHYKPASDESVLDAVVRAFHTLKQRMFPYAGTEQTDFLAGFFEAFAREKRRKEAWRRLLGRPGLVIAILAKGGMVADEALQQASSAQARMIVLSNKPPESDSEKEIDLDGWQADTLEDEKVPVQTNEMTTAWLAAVAALNRALRKEALECLARDFDLSFIDTLLRDFMAPVGRRYVVRASIARSVLAPLSDDQLRAAHRAVMNFLERARDLFDVDYPTQLSWCALHASAAGETDRALGLAESAIEQFGNQGAYARSVELYNELGSIRRNLRPETRVLVAWAQIQMGQSRRALDIITRILPASIGSRSERVHLRVVEAEALRTVSDPKHPGKSIDVLEGILREKPHKAADAEEKRWRLVAKHDLGRNLHYFRQDAARARDIFLDVVRECGDRPRFAYPKAAALRNLSDIFGRYTYGQVTADPDRAENYLREAADVARRNPGAAPLLAELLYLQAKFEHATGREGDAAVSLRRAIERARENGSGRILALSTNKLFWWQFGPATAENSRDNFHYADWQRIEDQLDFASGDPWVARALIASRLKAARCLHLQSNKTSAIDVLQKASERLEEDTYFLGKSDFQKLWQPVFAGLAVLKTPATGRDATPRHYDQDTWNKLMAIGTQITPAPNLGLADPKQLWEGVA